MPVRNPLPISTYIITLSREYVKVGQTLQLELSIMVGAIISRVYGTNWTSSVTGIPRKTLCKGSRLIMQTIKFGHKRPTRHRSLSLLRISVYKFFGRGLVQDYPREGFPHKNAVKEDRPKDPQYEGTGDGHTHSRDRNLSSTGR